MTFDPPRTFSASRPRPPRSAPPRCCPARRENVELRTEDGHRLVGELAVPESGEIKATLITLPPAAHARRLHGLPRLPEGLLPAAGAGRRGRAALQHPRDRHRRGAPAGGPSKKASGERFDVEAAVRFAVERGLPNRWLVGWSFGTELALMYGAVEPVASAGGGGRAALAPAAPGHRRAPDGNGRRPASR